MSIALRAFTETLDACKALRSVCFSLAWVIVENRDLAWKQLVEYVPHLPSTVHSITIEVDSVVGPVLLRGAEDLRRDFESLVTKRRPPTVVSFRPDEQPMLRIDQRKEIEGLLPRLAAEALLQF